MPHVTTLLAGMAGVIRKNAFSDNDGRTVPLVWNHNHTNPEAVIGHALLENRADGVYAYGTFNDTEEENVQRCWCSTEM